MAKLPKVKKGIGSGLTRLEKVRGLVLGVALAAGIGVTGALPTEGNAIHSPSLSTGISASEVSQKPFTLKPSTTAERNDQIAWHYSHQSHRSHYSHYSSRY